MADSGNTRASGSGCLGCLAMVVFFALVGWAFFGVDDPQAAIRFGFKAAVLWVGGILGVIVLVVAAVFGVDWFRRRRNRRKYWGH